MLCLMLYWMLICDHVTIHFTSATEVFTIKEINEWLKGSEVNI